MLHGVQSCREILLEDEAKGDLACQAPCSLMVVLLTSAIAFSASSQANMCVRDTRHGTTVLQW